jgi:hypothetical protein
MPPPRGLLKESPVSSLQSRRLLSKEAVVFGGVGKIRRGISTNGIHSMAMLKSTISEDDTKDRSIQTLGKR